MFYQTEHFPNRESRVVLHSDCDAYGVPRLDVRVRFAQRDIDTVMQLHRLLARRFAETGVGRLVYREEELEAEARRAATSFNSNAHHVGTTRMPNPTTQRVRRRRLHLFCLRVSIEDYGGKLVADRRRWTVPIDLKPVRPSGPIVIGENIS